MKFTVAQALVEIENLRYRIFRDTPSVFRTGVSYPSDSAGHLLRTLGLSFVDKPEAGVIPAFRFPKWKDGVVTKLPAPETSFGLDLSKTEVMDAGLKELANIKNLISLCLCDTMGTNAAVEELQKALSKCLILNCTIR